MILDCVIFFNELDTLELRFTILENVVDRFVVCEATHTFRGAPKPLVFAENRERFARWNDRIVHLVYDVTPDPSPWKNEWGQRAHLTTALIDLDPDDTVLIGDADEIPLPADVARRTPPGRIRTFRHTHCVGYLNRVNQQRWLGVRAIRYDDLGGRTLDQIRATMPEECDLVDSGWHVSTLGGPAAMIEKARAYSHSEIDIPYLTNAGSLRTLYDSSFESRCAPLEEVFPQLAGDARWAPFVWAAPAYEADEARALMHAYGCIASVPREATAASVFARPAPAWSRAGSERFGAAFRGVHATLDNAFAAVRRGEWLIIDGLGTFGAPDLAALSSRGVHVLAFARNARSFAVLNAVLDGGTYPTGEARGLSEYEALIAAAGYAIERRDDVRSSVFAPIVFEQPEPVDAAAGAFRFQQATHDMLQRFAAEAFIFVLRAPG